RQAGQVHMWETERETEGAALERRIRERFDIKSEELGADDLRQMFPGITREAKRGVLVPGNGYTVSPQRLVSTLQQLFTEAGGRSISESVLKIIPAEGGSGYRLLTNTGFHQAKTVVLAAGAQSPKLLAPLKIKMPLE